MKQRPLTTKPEVSRVDPQTMERAFEILSARSKKLGGESNLRAKSGHMTTSNDLTRASSSALTGTQLNLRHSQEVLTVPRNPSSALSNKPSSAFQNYQFPGGQPQINVTMFQTEEPNTLEKHRPSALQTNQLKLPYKPPEEKLPCHQRRITEEIGEFNESVSECTNERGSSQTMLTTRQSGPLLLHVASDNEKCQEVVTREEWSKQIQSRMRDLGQKIDIYLCGSFSPKGSSGFSPINSTENLQSQQILSVRQSPSRLNKVFELKEPDRFKPETHRVQQVPLEFERFKRQQRLKKLHQLVRCDKVDQMFNKDPSRKVLLSFEDTNPKSPVLKGRSSVFKLPNRSSSRRRLNEHSNSNLGGSSISSQTYEDSIVSPISKIKRESSMTKSSELDRASPRSAFMRNVRQKSSFNLRASLHSTAQPRARKPTQAHQKQINKLKLVRQDFILACQQIYSELLQTSVIRAKEIFLKGHTKETISILKKLSKLAALALDLPCLLRLYLLIIESLFLRDRFQECLMFCQHYICIQERNMYTKAPQQTAECLKFKAKCEMQINDYQQALNTLNFLLELSMRCEFTALEIQSYGWMALCHYYLSDVENCTYFLTRQMRGIVEPKGSELQQIYSLLRLNYQKSQENINSKRIGWEEDLFDQFLSKLQHTLSHSDSKKQPFDQSRQGFSHAAEFEKCPFVQPMLFHIRSIINFRYHLHDSVDQIFRQKHPQKVLSEQGYNEFLILSESLKQNRYPQCPQDGTIMLIDSLGNYNNFNPLQIKVPDYKPDQTIATSLQELKLPHPKMLRIDQFQQTSRKKVERKAYYDPVLRELLPTLYRGRHESTSVPKLKTHETNLDFETYLQDLQRRAKNRSSKKQNAPIYLSHINRPIKKKFKSEQERITYLTKHFNGFTEYIGQRVEKLQKPSFEAERDFITETDGYQALILGLAHLQAAIEQSTNKLRIVAEVKKQPSMRKITGILKVGKSFGGSGKKESPEPQRENQRQRLFICEDSPTTQKQAERKRMAQLGLVPVESEPSVMSPTSVANSNMQRAIKRKQTLLKIEEEEKRNKEELDRRDEIFSAGLRSRRGSIGTALLQRQSTVLDRRKSVQMTGGPAQNASNKMLRFQSQKTLNFISK